MIDNIRTVDEMVNRSITLKSELVSALAAPGYMLTFLLVFILLFSFTACGVKAPTVTTGTIQVIAAENFWGSIATQLGGTQTEVTSVINNPSVDPHEYESNPATARAFVKANYVILNGAGYDDWGQKLLDANPVKERLVLNVASGIGKKRGENPHFWYSPDYSSQVANQITRDYQLLKPLQAQYFIQQQTAFENDLSRYRQLIAFIKQAYSGVKVGATESIFVYMANTLGLDLISPPAFMNAVSSGNEPPAAAVALFQQQINQKQIAVLVYNKQTANVITANLKLLAESNGIPAVGITETVVPPELTFQDWQAAQLADLLKALQTGQKTGR